MTQRTALWRAMTIAGALLLSGCGNLQEHQTLDRYYGADSGVRNESVTPGALHSFIIDVARGHSTLENTLNGQRVRGIFLADDGRCQQVAVLTIDGARKTVASADSYEVCTGRIRNITLPEALPSYPDHPDARAAFASAQRAALLYGRQTVHYQRYEIIARAIGVAGSRPCLPVETVITYRSNLVFHDIQEQCNPDGPDSGRR